MDAPGLQEVALVSVVMVLPSAAATAATCQLGTAGRLYLRCV
jgi:hypothetical protein